MKSLILVVFGTGLVVGSAYYVSRTKTQTAQGCSVPESTGVVTTPGGRRQIHTDIPQASKQTVPEQPQLEPVSKVATAPPVPRMTESAVAESVELLLSPQASYDQKRGAWKHLREGGGLDQAIGDLQQRLANNPSSAESAAVLGHAYLQKCGTISDVRDQGVLAMSADKLFDTALSLDPQNWEARFTKAVGLSYWPASMGKSEEVIQHFTTLIQQQETQPAQPHFAESYVWLGDQYQKAGRNDDAHNVWVRGAALFPTDQKLSSKLASSP